MTNLFSRLFSETADVIIFSSWAFGASQAVHWPTLTPFFKVQNLQIHDPSSFSAKFVFSFRTFGRLHARQILAGPGFSRVQRLQIQASSDSSLLLSWIKKHD
jgi:hypothetical protein